MKNIRIFHAKALGESHKLKNIPCQDSANGIEDLENGIYIAAVSDGHGSKQYFRSDRGSKLLVDIALETITDFIKRQDSELLKVPFTAIPAQTTETKLQIVRKFTAQDNAFRRVNSAIIAKWNEAIRADWDNDPPTTDKMKELQVTDDYIRLFNAGTDIELAYGCTLIVFALTPEYWFAIQLGDGKCIAFDEEANAWEPIPWDDQCIGNTTTSICESTALENFRYCYGNDKTPVALFIGSDGMDGAYGTIDEFSVPLLTGLYENVIKSFVHNGYEDTVAEVRDMLPKLSERGITRDDMSLAGWIDLEGANKLMPVFLKRDIEQTEKELDEIEKSLSLKHNAFVQLKEKIKKKQSVCDKKKKDTHQALTELNRADNEYLKAKKRRDDAQTRHTSLNNDLSDLENEIRVTSLEINNSRSDVEKEKKQLDELQKKLSELKMEYNTLLTNTENQPTQEPDETTTVHKAVIINEQEKTTNHDTD